MPDADDDDRGVAGRHRRIGIQSVLAATTIGSVLLKSFIQGRDEDLSLSMTMFGEFLSLGPAQFVRWLENSRRSATADEPLRRLIVYLRSYDNDHIVWIDFWDAGRLKRQLAAFRQRRKDAKRRYDELHEFRNIKGELLAFSEACYVRHEVINLSAIKKIVRMRRR